jgi:hypothetical protein
VLAPVLDAVPLVDRDRSLAPDVERVLPLLRS